MFKQLLQIYQVQFSMQSTVNLLRDDIVNSFTDGMICKVKKCNFSSNYPCLFDILKKYNKMSANISTVGHMQYCFREVFV